MSSPNLLPASRVPPQTFDLNLISLPPPLPPDSVYTSCYCEENIYLLVQTFLAEANAQASRGLAWPWETYGVFISNRGKTVALWSQTLRAPNVVVWDYHVVLVLRPAASGDHQSDNFLRRNGDIPPHVRPRVVQAPVAQPIDLENGDPKPRDVGVDHVENLNVGWVYDFDTTLAVPCSWRDYLTGTFPYALNDNLKARIDDRLLSLFRVIPADVYVDNFASDRSHMIIHAPRSELRLSTNGVSTVAGAAIGSDAISLSLDAGEGLGDGGADGLDLKMVGRDHEGITALQYSSPPPPYLPLRGVKAREQGIVHNLMESFVAMEPDAISSRAAEEDEDVPERDLRTSARVGSPDDAGNAITTRAGDRSASAAVRYGQVMDMGAFVRWLSAADDASAPRWGS